MVLFLKFVQQVVQKKFVLTYHTWKKSSANRWDVSCPGGGGYPVWVHKGTEIIVWSNSLLRKKNHSAPPPPPYRMDRP